MPIVSPSTAFGRAARDFLSAASHLLNHPSETPLPVLFLLARSIELSLKAILLGAGKNVSELPRGRAGHDLTSLLTVTGHLAPSVAALPSESRLAINLLSSEYQATFLGYPDTGRTYTLPPIDLVEEAARTLLALAYPSDEADSTFHE